MRFGIILVVAVLFAPIVGCGSKITVDGTVRFEDGTPLKAGTVYFESADTSARGTLDANGRYVLSSQRAQDGVPPGTYRVYILGAAESGYDSQGQWTAKPLIDVKFQSATTSQLSCDVTKKTTFDITVTPP
ncbi:MAG: carboxypeptidase-like regulatory domain-containing protein [Planctomycetaceae bacterium]|nr:carboxypeptidase-like regulatory domain-containing protein [Planctomycetaceae bacterium]